MCKLLSANFSRLVKNKLFWGVLTVMFGFGLFEILFWLSLEVQYERLPADYAMVIGPIMAAFNGLYFGTEYSDGTIRNKIVVGCSRLSIFLSSLIVSAVVCLLCCAAYLLPVLSLGLHSGFLTMNSEVMMTLLNILLMGIAYCAIFLCVNMNCSNKAIASVVCILGVVALLVLCNSIMVSANQPEFIERGYGETADDIVWETIPNPQYIGGNLKLFCEFIIDFLPTGQTMQIALHSATRPVRMRVCSLVFTVLSTGVGAALFQRKNLK